MDAVPAAVTGHGSPPSTVPIRMKVYPQGKEPSFMSSLAPRNPARSAT